MFYVHTYRELFKDYVDVCFEKFGDRVKIWGTINEPLIYVYLGKRMGFPPQLQTQTDAPYIAYHNIILAHSQAVKLYKHKYQVYQFVSMINQLILIYCM